MPSTYIGLHYHLIFSTKHCQPFLSAEWRPRLHEYMGGTIRELGGFLQGVGGVADHVHLLFNLKATHRLADFVRELKKSSSIWISETFSLRDFHWQEGYAAFSVSPSALEAVRDYIARQEEHHRQRTFPDELTESSKNPAFHTIPNTSTER